MKPAQKDNTTLRLKVELRRKLLDLTDIPVVMETHGGYGKIYLSCYRNVKNGVVFETNPAKIDILVRQRPEWAVYECDCEKAISLGAGAHIPINFVDIDPYGEPWPVIDAFFQSNRPKVEQLVFAVNDGLRQNIQMGGAWHTGSMAGMVDRYGNDLFDRYLEICQEMLAEKASQSGYRLDRFGGYYCGAAKHMTHYGAIFSYVGRCA